MPIAIRDKRLGAAIAPDDIRLGHQRQRARDGGGEEGGDAQLARRVRIGVEIAAERDQRVELRVGGDVEMRDLRLAAR